MRPRWQLKKDDLAAWLWRSLLCVGLSAWGLARIGSAEYWVPGLAYSLLIIPARWGFKQPLLLAVALSYCVAYAAVSRLDGPSNPWVLRVAVVSAGSLLLALSLRLFGGLSKRKAVIQWALGTALAWPFWLAVLSGPEGSPRFQSWLLAFAAWQAPMSYLTFVQTKKGA